MCEMCDRLRDALESGDFGAAEQAQYDWLKEYAGADVAQFAREGILTEDEYHTYADQLETVKKSAEFLVIEGLRVMCGPLFEPLITRDTGTSAAQSLRNMALMAFGYGMKTGRRSEKAKAMMQSWKVVDDEQPD